MRSNALQLAGESHHLIQVARADGRQLYRFAFDEAVDADLALRIGEQRPGDAAHAELPKKSERAEFGLQAVPAIGSLLEVELRRIVAATAAHAIDTAVAPAPHA